MFRADELAGQEFIEPEWIVPNLICEGITLLSGTPKIGKSWMLINLGVACATGGAFLSDIQCNRTDALYLALEDTPRRLGSRLRTVCGWDPAPSNFVLSCEWPRFPVGTRQLDKWLESHPTVKLVMIDTLEMVRPPRRSNPYEDDYRALSGLRDLASKHHCAFVVVHHNRKTQTTMGGEEIDPLERVSGTMGLTGSVDTILVLSRLRGTALGELNVMGRDVREQRMVIRLIEEIGMWTKHEAGSRYPQMS